MSVFAEFLAPVTAFPFSELLRQHPDLRIEIDPVVPMGGSIHYAWLHDERAELVEAVNLLPAINEVRLLDSLPDRQLIRFEWPPHESIVTDLLASVGGLIVGAFGNSKGWTLRVRFPDQDSLRSFSTESRQQGLDVKLLQLFDPKRPLVNDGEEISPKQRQALEVAYEYGYFEIPREVTLEDLAKELGISEQGVSERLRRGLSSFLRTTLQQDASEDGNPTTDG